MPVQAIPLALIASLYPFGLAVLLLLFSAPRPKARAGVFLAGAVVCTLAIGSIIVIVLRGAGLNKDSAQTARSGLQLAIGILFLVAALVVARRPAKQGTGESRISKAAAESGLFAAFVAGIVLYLPSPSYLSALQDVGTAKLSSTAAAVWVVIVVALVLITIEVPVLLYQFAPGWTVPKLGAADAWLKTNARAVLIAVLAVLGAWEVIGGLAGLL
jgi:hypothetical protein